MSRMSKGWLHRLASPAGLFLLIEGLALLPFAPAMTRGQSKTDSTVSAGISKEELAKEGELKKVMEGGRNAFRAGKYDQAISSFQEALELTKDLDSKNAQDVRLWTTNDALAQIGNCYLQLHQLQEAETHLNTLLEFRKRNLPYDSSVAGAFENLAVVDVMQSNFPSGEARLKEGIAYLDECISHFKHSDIYDPQDIVANGDCRLKARLQMELANVYSNDSKFDEALSAYEDAFQTGDKFKAEPKSQIQVVTNAINVAQLAKRADKLKVWQDRSAALQVKKD